MARSLKRAVEEAEMLEDEDSEGWTQNGLSESEDPELLMETGSVVELSP